MKKTLFAVGCLLVVAFAASGLRSANAVNRSKRGQEIPIPRADTAASITLEDLVTESNLILTGKCAETNAAWTEDGRNLETFVTIKVDKVFKGDAGSTVTVALPGGIGNKGKFKLQMQYPGAPKIFMGEKALLFLQDRGLPDTYAITGFSAGKLSIVEGDDGEEWVSENPGVRKRQTGSGGGTADNQMVPMSAVEERIKKHLR